MAKIGVTLTIIEPRMYLCRFFCGKIQDIKIHFLSSSLVFSLHSHLEIFEAVETLDHVILINDFL